jgi:hypothetical protein
MTKGFVMANNNRVYVEKDYIVFEKTFDWSKVVSVAATEGIVKSNLNIDSVANSLMTYLQENIDIEESFSEYLESVSEEK